jgi:hypothetical protein
VADRANMDSFAGRCPHSRRAFALSIALLCCSLGAADSHGAEPSAARESQLRAAYVYNFAKFTKWSAQSFAGEDSPLTIGVIGSDEVAAALTSLTNSRSIEGHPVHVKALTSIEQSAGLQMLYIDASAANVRCRSGHSLARAGLLTIGDTDDFLACGGTIRLVVVADRLQFDINLEGAQRAGLSLSSQLLNLARYVRK